MGIWERKTIGELCDIGGGEVKTGPFGSQLHQSDYSDKGTPVVMPTDITDNGISERRIVRVSKNHVYRLAKHKLSFGDIVYGRRGDIGRQALVRNYSEGWLCGTGCLRITLANSEVIPEYLHLYLKLPEIITWIQNQAIGATMPNLNTQILRRIPITYPSLKVDQKKIVSMVFSYDDLIENNKRRIALLENMAEEIYREWFVRFRFPGYQTAEFEKGIPKGWELNRIDSLGKVITGKTPPTTNEKYYGGDILFIKTPDMHGNMFVYQTEEKLTEDGLTSQPSQIIQKKAICVSCIGTGGIVSMATNRCSTNQQINSLSLKNLVDLEWAFFTLKALKSTILAFGATGATMTNLSKGKFSAIKAIIPPEALRFEFHNISQSLFDQIQVLLQLNMNLINTRDNLLPRLISGKLSVEDLDIQFPPSMQDTPTAR